VSLSETAENLSKAGRSLGWVSAIDSAGRTIWIADAHRGNGKRISAFPGSTSASPPLPYSLFLARNILADL
jgi:hypothetical protein